MSSRSSANAEAGDMPRPSRDYSPAPSPRSLPRGTHRAIVVVREASGFLRSSLTSSCFEKLLVSPRVLIFILLHRRLVIQIGCALVPGPGDFQITRAGRQDDRRVAVRHVFSAGCDRGNAHEPRQMEHGRTGRVVIVGSESEGCMAF